MLQASIVVYRFYLQSALKVAEDFIFVGHLYRWLGKLFYFRW